MAIIPVDHKRKDAVRLWSTFANLVSDKLFGKNENQTEEISLVSVVHVDPPFVFLKYCR